MEYSFSHSLTYTNRGDVPVAVIAESLVANERLLQESLRLLSIWEPNLKVEKVTVRLGSLSHESPLKQYYIIALLAAFQQDIRSEVPDLIQKITGYNMPDNMDALVSILVVGTALFIASEVVERLVPGKSVKAMREDLRLQLRHASKILGKTEDEVREAFEGHFNQPRRRRLFPKVRDFFRPAKIEQGAQIETGSGERVSAEAISEIPSDLELSEIDLKDHYDISGVAIEIHRADIDFGDRGWVAVIKEVSENRHKLYLPADIAPSDLYGRKRIIGDVTVLEEANKNGQVGIKAYFLNRIVG